jgi:hypothetical protein
MEYLTVTDAMQRYQIGRHKINALIKNHSTHAKKTPLPNKGGFKWQLEKAFFDKLLLTADTSDGFALDTERNAKTHISDGHGIGSNQTDGTNGTFHASERTDGHTDGTPGTDGTKSNQSPAFEMQNEIHFLRATVARQNLIISDQNKTIFALTVARKELADGRNATPPTASNGLFYVLAVLLACVCAVLLLIALDAF